MCLEISLPYWSEILSSHISIKQLKSAPEISSHAGVQMNRLYRLHLENTEMPAKFSVLLQLREMLDIKEADAEKLEQEVLGSSSSFSI